jgi:hypothetical protein
MRAWHGSSVLFELFDLRCFGSGEGGTNSPYGIYLAEHRPGGEYFGRYLHNRNGTGYLYEVELTLAAEELLDEQGNHPETRERLGYPLLDLEERLPGKAFAAYARSRGIHCFRLWEGTKPSHGYTYRCVSPERIAIVSCYEYDAKSVSWRNCR